MQLQEQHPSNDVEIQCSLNENINSHESIDKETVDKFSSENEQLKSQNEHLLNELARLTQVENRDRTRSIEQADLRRQYDEISIQYNELKQNYNELKEKYRENQLSYENDIKHLNGWDADFWCRLTEEQIASEKEYLATKGEEWDDSFADQSDYFVTLDLNSLE